MKVRLGPMLLLGLALASAAGAARQPTAPGTWQRLPAAPAAAAIPYGRVAVWTGRQMVVFGDATPRSSRNVAFSYAPATRRWRALSPPAGPPGGLEGAWAAVWTGRLVLVVGPTARLSYEPRTNRWRPLGGPPLGATSGLLAWTGKEMITWGGGCCGDVSADGWAYDPATGAWRRLAKAPVAGQQRPVGAWTGKELVILPGEDPNGRPTGGAAYDPASDTWRRIAKPPQKRIGPSAVWDGREVLVVGGIGPVRTKSGRLAAVPFAYDPATDRWRTLAAMDGGAYGRLGAGVVWTGTRLLLWGGSSEGAGSEIVAPHGLAYDPRRNRWSELPGAPLLPRNGPAAVWTGRALLVWGGDAIIPWTHSDTWPLVDGATFTPAV